MKRIINYIVIVSLFLNITSCSEDFLDTEPAGSISAEQVASSPDANAALVSGIYANMRTTGIGGTTRHVDHGHKGILSAMDMCGHDVVLNNFNWYIFFYNFNGRIATSDRTSIIWTTYYTLIADANTVILGLEEKESLTQEEEFLLGQALAIKAFSLFNLVRVYSDTYIGNENSPGIPIPDKREFDGKPRGTVKEVYDWIIPSLERAITLLDGFSRDSKQAIDRQVAQGILAQVYLETGNWSEAATMANAAKQGYGLMTGEEWITDGFDQISNKEWMWGAEITSQLTGFYNSYFSHFDSSNVGYGGDLGGYKLMDSRLYEQISPTDLRRQAWIDPIEGNADYPDIPGYANIKFIDPTFFEGDFLYMRASEMWLIEAEALARDGNPSAADILFDLISLRDPEYVKSTNTGDDLVEEIYLQRRIELWGEGFGYLDLKRLKKPLQRSGGNHLDFGVESARILDEAPGGPLFKFQIPEGEISSNPNINIEDQNE
ncbi:RagB/SusD family nutrient uptake outer membrane protein [Flagellimonas onchidii]|uniref:RagB/SusD family nutrient uptake outer membrane protein n=1 Tax=Flagellimonas onchidii TaxID=2562684 RepID=UPI0010A5B12D|nr:RagB/SusD family nutrient uptake outer membrane protein [Allomuricauda onchidii]